MPLLFFLKCYYNENSLSQFWFNRMKSTDIFIKSKKQQQQQREEAALLKFQSRGEKQSCMFDLQKNENICDSKQKTATARIKMRIESYSQPLKKKNSDEIPIFYFFFIVRPSRNKNFFQFKRRAGLTCYLEDISLKLRSPFKITVSKKISLFFLGKKDFF